MLDDETVLDVGTFQENRLRGKSGGFEPDGHDVSCPYRCYKDGVLALWV